MPLVWSGGTDGVLSPHATVFANAPDGRYEPSDEPRVVVGVAMSEELLPEDIGRPAMVEKVAAAVRTAMASAGIEDTADVHYVQTKTPLLVLETINDARSRGHDVVTEDTLKSMDISNSTTALGIAVALGEIGMPAPTQIHQRPLALLLGGVVLVRRRARPRPGRRGRQCARRRRAVPDRSRRHA